MPNHPSYLAPSRVFGRPIVGGPGLQPIDYAATRIGSPTIPGSSVYPATERVRVSLLDLVWENWLPFTWTIVSRFIKPRPPTEPWQSPFDVDGSERITREGSFPSSSRPFPYPYMIGAVSGNMPMLDQWSMAWAWGKTPSGPGVLTPTPVPWDASYPNLPKVTG